MSGFSAELGRGACFPWGSQGWLSGVQGVARLAWTSSDSFAHRRGALSGWASWRGPRPCPSVVSQGWFTPVTNRKERRPFLCTKGSSHLAVWSRPHNSCKQPRPDPPSPALTQPSEEGLFAQSSVGREEDGDSVGSKSV